MLHAIAIGKVNLFEDFYFEWLSYASWTVDAATNQKQIVGDNGTIRLHNLGNYAKKTTTVTIHSFM